MDVQRASLIGGRRCTHPCCSLSNRDSSLRILLAAAALCTLPTVADATLVTYRFTGGTDINQAVAFTVTFDTVALAAADNAAGGDGIDGQLSGPTPGLATVNVEQGLPAFLTSGTVDQAIQFSADNPFSAGLSLTVTSDASNGPEPDFSSLTLYADGTTVQSRLVDGVRLPVLDGVPLSFNYAAKLGGTRSSANGTVSLSTAIVPEPAVWMTMIAGFGLIGGTLRRRQPALA